MTVEEVVSAIKSLPDKQCASDPMSTHLLKDCADILAPFFVELFNQSLRTGSVPTVFRLDALASSSVIATATWLGGWLGGWLSVTAGIVSK